jgi:ABC-2 type transport system permease protein
MRWLLLKDLQILRRSPLQAVLLVAYPILIAILVGFAISRGPEKPRVAFLNEVPKDTSVSVGGDTLDVVNARDTLCQKIDCIRVSSRRQAVDMVRSGDVLGALILPRDLADQINSLASLNPGQPKVEVIVNEEDPLKAQIVNDRISSLLTQANLLIARRVARTGSDYLNLILNGGNLSFFGQNFNVLGLKSSARILQALRPAVPHGALRQSLDEVVSFATLARDNLDLAGPLLNAVAEPIRVDKHLVNGSAPPLDIFAIAVAATVTLMFVTLLLVAGSLALEREENAFSRLTRGLVSRLALLAEKVCLGVAVSLIVTVLMLAGLELFVNLQWSRFGLWLVAILGGGAGFAAAGAALGAATREVRAASLLAFMIALPVAFLSLVPSGAVGPGLYDVIKVVTALFPFKPALHAMTAALDPSGPSLGTALLHLAVLTLAYGALARLALRRFATL